MHIFPAPTHVRAPWKRWSTKCRSGWSFARRCSGMRERNTNSGICRRSEEIQINLAGIFVVPPRMDADWKQRSMALGRASIVLPYVKTDCQGSFEVTNNSLAKAVLRLERQGRPVETLETQCRGRIGDGRPLKLISDDCAIARRSATIAYAEGLNAIPMCVPGTSKSTSGFLVMQ